MIFSWISWMTWCCITAASVPYRQRLADWRGDKFVLNLFQYTQIHAHVYWVYVCEAWWVCIPCLCLCATDNNNDNNNNVIQRCVVGTARTVQILKMYTLHAWHVVECIVNENFACNEEAETAFGVCMCVCVHIFCSRFTLNFFLHISVHMKMIIKIIIISEAQRRIHTHRFFFVHLKLFAVPLFKHHFLSFAFSSIFSPP